MKLYQSLGPNPRVVLMYLAETGAQVDRQFVDIMAAENRQPDFCAKSPLGHTPLLELDDGGCTSQSHSARDILPGAPCGPQAVGPTCRAPA
ncbi:MAG: glutathione S-transferase N-terminal domain-containing protein, partial [Sphingopyxis sp.]|nr:glutathione S-transferase N-terminal domain-containing protein [Sphingopyxis sp.]